jgi:hypothetical protein
LELVVLPVCQGNCKLPISDTENNDDESVDHR